MMRGSLLQRVAQWDVKVSLALQARRTAVLNFVAQALSWSGAGGVWFGIGGGLYVLHRRGVDLVPETPLFLSSMFGSFVVLLVGGVLKSATKRRRPFMTDTGITAAIWAPGKARSFPSTHAATSMLLAAALLITGHPFGPAVLAWAIGVTFSRVWLGVHFASDVIAGTLLGVAFGFVPWIAVTKIAFS
ncbi:MAG: phosphatase PAP2 family protein [Archangium sp.]